VRQCHGVGTNGTPEPSAPRMWALTWKHCPRCAVVCWGKNEHPDVTAKRSDVKFPDSRGRRGQHAHIRPRGVSAHELRDRSVAARRKKMSTQASNYSNKSRASKSPLARKNQTAFAPDSLQPLQAPRQTSGRLLISLLFFAHPIRHTRCAIRSRARRG
jgi:hypothetical protein